MNTDSKIRLLKETAEKNSGIYVMDVTKPDFATEFNGFEVFFNCAFFRDQVHKKSPHGDVLGFNNVALSMLKYSEEEKLHVFFHELAHASGGSRHLNRPSIVTPYKSRTDEIYAKEELTAEVTANALMQHFKLANEKTEQIHQAYVTREKLKVFEKQFEEAKKDAEVAFDYILKNWLHDINFSEEKAT